jgi:hypothetical protein
MSKTEALDLSARGLMAIGAIGIVIAILLWIGKPAAEAAWRLQVWLTAALHGLRQRVAHLLIVSGAVRSDGPAHSLDILGDGAVDGQPDPQPEPTLPAPPVFKGFLPAPDEPGPDSPIWVDPADREPRPEPQPAAEPVKGASVRHWPSIPRAEKVCVRPVDALLYPGGQQPVWTDDHEITTAWQSLREAHPEIYAEAGSRW